MQNLTEAQTPNANLRPPSLFSLALESRALLDIAALPYSLMRSKLFKKRRAVKGALPIIMFPGFGSNETYMKALGYHLQNLGYQNEGWGLGTNLAGNNFEHRLEDLSPHWEVDLPEAYDPESYKGEFGVSYLCDKAMARVKRRVAELNSPVILIGWSLGGVIARECARELSEEVAQVITFGTPVIGGPKYSRAADYFKANEHDLDWIERAVDKRNTKPIQQPVTTIYSGTDGIVSSGAAVDTISPNGKNIKVNVSHLGMGFNRKIWRIVGRELKQGSRERSQSQGTA